MEASRVFIDGALAGRVALLATPLGAALSGSVITLDGALDNRPGPWPPQGLTRDGQVPTEARRPIV